MNGDFHVDPDELEASVEPDDSYAGWSVDDDRSRAQRRSLSLGILAMLPLFGAYELGLAATGDAQRNTSELVLFQAAAVLPFPARDVRLALLLALAAVAVVTCFRRRVALGPGLARIVLEGLVAAVLFGPALALAMRLIPEGVGRLHVSAGPPAQAPSLAQAAIVLGGAAYEEITFRIGVLSLTFLGVSSILAFFGAPQRGSRCAAQIVAVLSSSLAFAAFHLATFNGWLGAGGEPFIPAVFAWRALAGVLLAVLFLWRGPGVAAWSHGLFNFGLFLGAGPEVLL